MSHFIEHTHQTTRLTRAAVLRGFRQVLGITACMCLGLAADGLAFTTSKTALTFYAVQGAANPPIQTITVSNSSSTAASLTTSDNASWLYVSPTNTYMTNTANLTVIVTSSTLGAGTYKANITTKLGTWGSKVVPVTLIVSPATSPPPTSPPAATSTATLTWNAATGTTISGYKVYIGEAPRLYTQTITVGNVISYTANNLIVGRTYYFVVRAYNNAGQSAPSNEVSKTIQ